MKALMLAPLLAACGTITPFYVSHAVAPPPGDGREWHSCAGGVACEEGYACTKDGCEWCGPGATRCTEGND